jgi:hypothetical protein
MLEFTRRYSLHQFQRILASLDLGILSTTSLPLTNDLVMDHNQCNGRDRLAGNNGREFGGHKTVVSTAEGKLH